MSDRQKELSDYRLQQAEEQIKTAELVIQAVKEYLKDNYMLLFDIL